MNLCPVREYCGSCNFQGVPYEEQLSIKHKRIESLLGKYGKVNPIIGMKDPEHYRNKVQVSFSYDENHHLIYGNYMEGSHVIVPNNECILVDEKANKIIQSIVKLIKKYNISIYDERSRRGSLRHLVIRCTNLNEYMVVLVSATSFVNKQDLFVKDIVKYNPLVKTIVLNINNRASSMVLGPKNIVLYGKGYILDELCGMKFRISASSFYQVNKRQTEILYKTAIDLANFKGNETIIDAYCGTGTIGLVASKNVKKVLGVEINIDAIKDANLNAKLNKVNNIEFVCEDAGQYMKYLASKHFKVDTVIMDPPRSGSDKKFMDSLLTMNPEKIVYISCGPDSLAANLKYLSKSYKVCAIQPVDLFPFVNHVETVVLLSGEKVDGHIDIDLDVEKLEGKSGTATYAEIKAYIKEKYGFNVTSLYIGQIKDKAGIKDRKNYNTGSGKTKVPTCPADKEEAIMEAFKHFNLL